MYNRNVINLARNQFFKMTPKLYLSSTVVGFIFLICFYFNTIILNFLNIFYSGFSKRCSRFVKHFRYFLHNPWKSLKTKVWHKPAFRCPSGEHLVSITTPHTHQQCRTKWTSEEAGQFPLNSLKNLSAYQPQLSSQTGEE